MTAWTSDELNKIGRAEELDIAPLGRDGAWFRAVQARHEGRIRAGGVEKNVDFVEETDPGINDQIDAAYRTKYRR